MSKKKRGNPENETDPVVVKFKGIINTEDLQKIGPDGHYTETGRRITIEAKRLVVSAHSTRNQPLTEFGWAAPGHSMVVAVRFGAPPIFEKPPIVEETSPISRALVVIPKVKI